jgi:hypothetical protein
MAAEAQHLPVERIQLVRAIRSRAEPGQPDDLHRVRLNASIVQRAPPPRSRDAARGERVARDDLRSLWR